jgi:hypothetical protein
VLALPRRCRAASAGAPGTFDIFNSDQIGRLATFGECRLMAWLIARKRLSSPLIKKDFRVYHPLLARGDYTAVTMNHQKWPRAEWH